MYNILKETLLLIHLFKIVCILLQSQVGVPIISESAEQREMECSDKHHHRLSTLMQRRTGRVTCFTKLQFPPPPPLPLEFLSSTRVIETENVFSVFFHRKQKGWIGYAPSPQLFLTNFQVSISLTTSCTSALIPRAKCNIRRKIPCITNVSSVFILLQSMQGWIQSLNQSTTANAISKFTTCASRHIVRPCLGHLSFLIAHYVICVNLRLQRNLSPLQLRCFCIPYMMCSMMQYRFASDSPNNDPDNLENGWAKLHIFLSSGVGGIIRLMPKHCWCFPTIIVQEGLHCLKIFPELKPVAPTIAADCSDLTAIADAVSKLQS